VEHFPALPYQDIPEFYAKVCGYSDISAFCLRFAILTGCRTQNARLSSWDQVDLKLNIWKIPKDQMKIKDEEHRVPLSNECIALLESLQKIRVSSYIFPGIKENSPINENALLLFRKKLGYSHVTVHGFRSTFKDWATEEKDYPDNISDMALAHVAENATKAAYKRGDLFEKRRKLMEEWAVYCCSQNSNNHPSIRNGFEDECTTDKDVD
jgi:integrase